MLLLHLNLLESLVIASTARLTTRSSGEGQSAVGVLGLTWARPYSVDSSGGCFLSGGVSEHFSGSGARIAQPASTKSVSGSRTTLRFITSLVVTSGGFSPFARSTTRDGAGEAGFA